VGLFYARPLHGPPPCHDVENKHGPLPLVPEMLGAIVVAIGLIVLIVVTAVVSIASKAQSHKAKD